MRLIFSQCGHTRCSVSLMAAVWGAAARFSRFTAHLQLLAQFLQVPDDHIGCEFPRIEYSLRVTPQPCDLQSVGLGADHIEGISGYEPRRLCVSSGQLVHERIYGRIGLEGLERLDAHYGLQIVAEAGILEHTP